MTAMERDVNIHRLALFGIPPEDARGDVKGVRRMLARLIAAESLSLVEMQTARDMAKLLCDVPAEAYLFLAAMFLSQRGGNTFLRPEKGIALLVTGGHMEKSDDSDRYGNVAYGVDVKDAWPRAAAAAESLRGEIVIKRGDAIGDCWFFARNAAAIDAVSEGLSVRAGRKTGDAKLSKEELASAIAFKGFTLNAEQEKAVKTAATSMFTVVTGGPGTGKTTIICAILRAFMGRGLSPEDIALVAPTGRAAQRMGEALRNQCAKAEGLDDGMRVGIGALNGSTIHSLLGGSPPNWKYTAENRLPLKLVVVDESSMVDVLLMKALVAALPDDCRLVLLGDKDQLPSVEAGAVLGDIVGGEGECVVRLNETNRFTGAIAKCAAAIKDGDAEAFAASATCIRQGDERWLDDFDDESTENGCFRYVLEGRDRRRPCHAALVHWAERHGLFEGGELVRLASDRRLRADSALTDGVNSPKARAIFAALDRARILAVVRSGPFGVQGINDLLVMWRFGGRMPANPLERAGVPVIVTRNTPARNLWNGDIGVTVEGPTGMSVLFPRGDGVVACPVGLLPEHDVAYAITVHKSQGSEFGNVLVVLPDDEGHPLLNRQLIYTGVTRARLRAAILGTEPAFRCAIARRLERDTGIALSHGAAVDRKEAR